MLQTWRNAAKWLFPVVVILFVGIFVFTETSGLTSRPVTRGTTVGSVNGQDITYDTWLRTVDDRTKQVQAQRDKPLTLDETRRLQDETFNDIVNNMLLAQEFQRRGITATDDEIRQATLNYPPSEFQRNPEFQTNGQFDLEKWQRFVRSPIAKQQGLYAYLEQRYRSEIPQSKLFNAVAATAYVTDAQLWWLYQAQHDSAQIAYVAFSPDPIPDSAAKVTEAEVQAWYDAHKKDFGPRPARAVVDVTSIPRVVTAADSAAVRDHLLALRKEIEGGAKFEDVAKRESADSGSAVQGGALGKSAKGSFVPEFEKTVWSLTPGELSQPVLTQFGYHLIRVDERKGDTATVHHILLHIAQSDASAAHTDSIADELSKYTGEGGGAGKFDSAAKKLGLSIAHATVVEGEPLSLAGKYVPDVAAWAFGGARPGEVSDLISADDGYYLARLDSLQPGGAPGIAALRPEITREIARGKKIDLLVGRAQRVAQAAAGGQSLEAAASSQSLKVAESPMFTRVTPIPGIGQFTEVSGAAFALPVGAISSPIKTRDGVYVIRVDKRANADRAAFEKQKAAQRTQMLESLRQQRVREFVTSLRKNSKVVDDRKKIDALSRNATG